MDSLNDWVFLILSFPMGILANLATPLFRSFFKYTIPSKRESIMATIREIRKINILENYRSFLEYRRDPGVMYIDFFMSLPFVLLVMLVAVAILALGTKLIFVLFAILIPSLSNTVNAILPDIPGYLTLFFIIGYLGTIMGFSYLFSITSTSYYLKYPEEYKEKAIKHLIKLGHNPATLDDIEKQEAMKRFNKDDYWDIGTVWQNTAPVKHDEGNFFEIERLEIMNRTTLCWEKN